MNTIEIVDYKQIFKNWINQKYLDYRGISRKSVADFSRHIGVSQQVMNGWINYGSLPSSKYLPFLAEKFGYEVYDVCGLLRPNSEAFAIANSNPSLPKRYEHIQNAVEEASQKIRELGIQKDSDEAEEVVKAVFRKYGMDHLLTTREEK